MFSVGCHSQSINSRAAIVNRFFSSRPILPPIRVSRHQDGQRPTPPSLVINGRVFGLGEIADGFAGHGGLLAGRLAYRLESMRVNGDMYRKWRFCMHKKKGSGSKAVTSPLTVRRVCVYLSTRAFQRNGVLIWRFMG